MSLSFSSLRALTQNDLNRTASETTVCSKKKIESCESIIFFKRQKTIFCCLSKTHSIDILSSTIIKHARISLISFLSFFHFDQTSQFFKKKREKSRVEKTSEVLKKKHERSRVEKKFEALKKKHERSRVEKTSKALKKKRERSRVEKTSKVLKKKHEKSRVEKTSEALKKSVKNLESKRRQKLRRIRMNDLENSIKLRKKRRKCLKNAIKRRKRIKEYLENTTERRKRRIKNLNKSTSLAHQIRISIARSLRL